MRKRVILTLLLIFALMIPMRSASWATKNASKGLQRIATYTAEMGVAWIGGFCAVYGADLIFPYVYRYVPSVLLPKGDYFFARYASPFIGMGATAGVVSVGTLLRQRGSFAGALIGSVIGATLPYFVWRIYPDIRGIWPSFSLSPSFPEDDLLLIGGEIVPDAAIGAVVGYNYKLVKDDKKELLYCFIGCFIGRYLPHALSRMYKFFQHFP